MGFELALKWTLLAHLVCLTPFVMAAELRFSEAIPSINDISSDAMHEPFYSIPVSLVGTDEPSMSDKPGRPLDPSEFNQANDIQLANAPPIEGKDPITMAGLFQGDIVIPNMETLNSLNQQSSRLSLTRNAIKAKDERWSGGIIPYTISSRFDNSERSTIAKAMGTFHKKSCIRFIPRTNQKDYIYIWKGTGCSSAVGRIGGQQRVSLAQGCIYYGIVIHELLHTAGFWHEQSRADRDNFVTVIEQNVRDGMLFNFDKYNWNFIQNLSEPYDTSSVMHYGAYTFSKGKNLPTIITRDNSEIGQRVDISKIDVKKLNKLYQCDGDKIDGTNVKTTPRPSPTPSTSCNDFNEFCSYWSKEGECTNNAAWMMVNCKKSCNSCGNKCEDTNKYCSDWASYGQCTENPFYMQLYCKKSCNIC